MSLEVIYVKICPSGDKDREGNPGSSGLPVFYFLLGLKLISQCLLKTFSS